MSTPIPLYRRHIRHTCRVLPAPDRFLLGIVPALSNGKPVPRRTVEYNNDGSEALGRYPPRRKAARTRGAPRHPTNPRFRSNRSRDRRRAAAQTCHALPMASRSRLNPQGKGYTGCRGPAVLGRARSMPGVSWISTFKPSCYPKEKGSGSGRSLFLWEKLRAGLDWSTGIQAAPWTAWPPPCRRWLGGSGRSFPLAGNHAADQRELHGKGARESTGMRTVRRRFHSAPAEAQCDGSRQP